MHAGHRSPFLGVALLGLALLSLGPGCATYLLWRDSDAPTEREPQLEIVRVTLDDDVLRVELTLPSGRPHEVSFTVAGELASEPVQASYRARGDGTREATLSPWRITTTWDSVVVTRLDGVRQECGVPRDAPPPKRTASRLDAEWVLKAALTPLVAALDLGLLPLEAVGYCVFLVAFHP